MLAEAASANPTVTGAIRQAARMTGANFHYLLATAQVELNLNPNAPATTSSAKGLFQFIEQTWLADPEGAGAGAGLRPLRRRDRAAAVRAIYEVTESAACTMRS